jgi:hypothetical protein
MKRFLQIKDFPFLLTLLFTLAGWIFLRLSSAITSSPTIEYKWVKLQTERDTTTGYFRLINLTNDKKFSDLEFLIHLDTSDYNKGTFVDANFDAVPPAPQYSFKPNLSFYTVVYTIPKFNPKEEYHLRVSIAGNKKPIFLSLSENERDIILIRKASLVTFLIRNEEYVYFIAFVIVILLILLYFFTLKPEEKKP